MGKLVTLEQTVPWEVALMRVVDRRLPEREYVFILSLKYHGFRLVFSSRYLKKRKGYIIPATKREDANGIDFWVKMPGEKQLRPIQVTQRGVRMYRKYHEHRMGKLDEFVEHSHKRLAWKRRRCKRNGIVFVLIRDFDGLCTNPTIAWGDVKALRYATGHIQR